MKVWGNYVFRVGIKPSLFSALFIIDWISLIWEVISFCQFCSNHTMDFFLRKVMLSSTGEKKLDSKVWFYQLRQGNLSLLLLIHYHRDQVGMVNNMFFLSIVIFSNFTCDSSSPTFLLLFFSLYILLCEIFPRHAYVVFDRTFIARCHAKWLGWSAYDIN